LIGLKRGTVQLVPHENRWLDLGEELCDQVRSACRNQQIRVEHVGSTSVPGLSAKPIIDLALGLPSEDIIAEVKSALLGANFLYRGEGDGSVGHLFVREIEPDVRSVHLHAVLFGSHDWEDYVLFRDTLRDDSETRVAYGSLKRQNAKDFEHDRKGYTAAKEEFVQATLARSRQKMR
jgi:GrpB-like predicted nucleotidyltransferase (UPF0157 family)